MAVDKDKNTQILLTVPNELLTEIENFQFEHRIKNRSEAIRILISGGLENFKVAEID